MRLLMRTHHATALAVVGWVLFFSYPGRTVPKACPNCLVDLPEQTMSIAAFNSREQCETAGNKLVSDFYASAKKNDQKVVLPPAKPRCTEQPPK